MMAIQQPQKKKRNQNGDWFYIKTEKRWAQRQKQKEEKAGYLKRKINFFVTK